MKSAGILPSEGHHSTWTLQSPPPPSPDSFQFNYKSVRMLPKQPIVYSKLFPIDWPRSWRCQRRHCHGILTNCPLRKSRWRQNSVVTNVFIRYAAGCALCNQRWIEFPMDSEPITLPAPTPKRIVLPAPNSVILTPGSKPFRPQLSTTNRTPRLIHFPWFWTRFRTLKTPSPSNPSSCSPMTLTQNPYSPQLRKPFPVSWLQSRLQTLPPPSTPAAVPTFISSSYEPSS